MTQSPSFTQRRSSNPLSAAERQKILTNPGFGKYFTDHMVTIDWTIEQSWHDARVVPYGPLQIDPASAVLHYAQEIFEGLKAYRHADGSIWTFRPTMNAARLQRSAQRVALPQLPIDLFVESVRQLVQIDADWVPSAPQTSLYLRPFIIANENFLGVRPAERAAYHVIASPAGSYFANGLAPVSIWLAQQFNRAGKGGTGAAKCGGNYAASLAPQQEAQQNNCSQVLFLDAETQTYLEELGGMNLFLVRKDKTVLTPKSDSILAGVTCDSIKQIAQDMGYKVEHRPITIQEWREGFEKGDITEMFACGTAAVVAPIACLKAKDFTIGRPDAPSGEVTLAIREKLINIQYGTEPDLHQWMVKLV